MLVASSSHVPNGGTKAREQEAVGDPLQPSIPQPSICGLPESCFPGWELQGGPALPSCLGKGEGVGTGLPVCTKQGQAGCGWAAPGMDRGFQTAWQGGGHHAMLHEHGTCHQSKQCITHSIRDVSFGAGDPGHHPAAPGTAPCALQRNLLQSRCCTKLRCENSMSF